MDDEYDTAPPAARAGPPPAPPAASRAIAEPAPPAAGYPPPPGYQPQGERKGKLAMKRIPIGFAAFLVMLGVVLLFVGIMVCQATAFIEEPDPDDYDYDEYDDYQEDMRAYEDEVEQTQASGRLITWLGTMIVSFVMIFVGITDEDIRWQVRASMVSGSAALMITSLILSSFAFGF